MIALNEKFKLLFQTDKRYIILTGGRGSSKSFHVSTFCNLLSYEQGHRILFTRYTLTSAELSIIPEFKEKIELLERGYDFTINKNEIVNNRTGSDILFRGIKTSSGVQTASLKSMQGITTWVVDEAEELTDESVFDKVDKSIRVKNKQNRIIIVLNPTNREHWIWKKFFDKTHKVVQVDGYDTYISTHPDVCHIHTTYFDNIQNLSNSFLKVVENDRVHDKHKYATEMIGGWLIDLPGTLYKRAEVKRFSMSELKPEGREAILGYMDIADEGTDAWAFPIGYIYKGKVFITDVLFSTDNADVTIPLSVALFQKHNVDYCRVESNNQGSMAIKALRQYLPAEKLLPVHSSTSKHTRILLAQPFILQNFYFLTESEIIPNSDYDKFMRQIFDYMRQKGETKDKDDAPDALSGLAKFIQSYLPHLFT